jgi:hypothetical protein
MPDNFSRALAATAALALACEAGKQRKVLLSARPSALRRIVSGPRAKPKYKWPFSQLRSRNQKTGHALVAPRSAKNLARSLQGMAPNLQANLRRWWTCHEAVTDAVHISAALYPGYVDENLDIAPR